MIYNPYQNNYQNIQQQIQQQIQQLQQLQNIQQNIPRGSFIQVKDYQEVVNYPTDASGNPTLFMNENTGVFWVKKFIDGSNKIQAYSFAPINDFSSEMINNTREENKPLKTDLNHDIIDNLMKRITKLEDMNDEIVKLLKNKVVKNENKSDATDK